MKKQSCITVRERAGIGSGTISRESVSTACSFVVFGKLVSLKNRRRMLKNRKTGKMFPAKSSEAERYMQDFCLQVPAKYRDLRLGSLENPLRATIEVYYPSRRSDLDVALLMDCLQEAGVIGNDRFVIEQHLYAEVDPKNPRVYICIEEI